VILLHAGLQTDGILLWGERSADGKVRRSKRSGAALPRTHPRDAGADGLADALQTIGLAAWRRRPEPRVAWLPSAGGEPLPSSSLLADAAPPKPSAIDPWTVTTHGLDASGAAELLALCIGRTALAPGLFVGSDLAFAVDVLRFAAALVAREQFLPGLESREGEWRALWTPVIDGSDSARLRNLAQAMPAACRALDGSSRTPPRVRPDAILEGLVTALVDHLVRASGRDEAARPRGFDSAHDQWLHALRARESTLRGSEADLNRLALQVREWRRPVTDGSGAPYRLTFRLEEPAPTDELLSAPRNGWYVRYLLQSVKDPSLLVPADEVYGARGRKAALLAARGYDAQEHLLGSLGLAAGIDARIEKSLRRARPTGYSLDTPGAFEFLSTSAASLQQAGFGVLLPGWWTRKGTKVRLSLKAAVQSPKLKAGAGLALDDLVHFQWQLAVGGETLTRAELEELARLKTPLVRVRGQWVQMSAEEIEAALRFWKERERATTTVRDVVSLALGAVATPGGLAVDGVVAEGAVYDLLSRLEGRQALADLEPPEGFGGVLRPYQIRGYSWLAFLGQLGFGACLADDMGLGKTIQALALMQREWRAGRRGPTLLVCPMSVVGNWQREAERFTPELPLLVHHGLGRSRGNSFAHDAARQALVISSYSLLHRDLEALRSVAWAGVILDEAQNVKNPETRQARAARSLSASYRIALTGTPVENNVADLWSIMEFLNPGLLGSQAEFKRRFFVPIQAGRDQDALARLKRLVAPFILRRMKTDKAILADLPDKMEMKVFCNLTREQASLYAAVLEEATREIEATEGIRRKGVVLATLAKLKQVCNHPAHFLGDNSTLGGRSGKLARLTEMLEEVLEEGDRALVFTQFAEMGAMLRRHLQESFGREVLFLHGGTTKSERDHMVDRFQRAPDAPEIFVLSLKAGGTGLNLTRASQVFHFDRWWNPAVENQATDRAFRIGQTRRVQVRKLVCTGTLEERIDGMIEAKKDLADRIVGTGEGWLTELSTDDLKDVLALRPEAVAE
jgi:SNF2 family DNA or RNA helicase